MRRHRRHPEHPHHGQELVGAGAAVGVRHYADRIVLVALLPRRNRVEIPCPLAIGRAHASPIGYHWSAVGNGNLT